MFTKEYRKNYKINYLLAYPIILAHAGHMIASITDNIMVGHIGSVYLAASSLANNVFAIFLLFAVGLSIGVTPLVGNAFGERDFKQCKILFSNSMVFAFVSALIVCLLMLCFNFFFVHMNQPPEVIALAVPYYNILVISMFPYMFFLMGKQFIEGFELTKPAFRVTLICNVLNVVLNYIFIYGKFGFPAMELNGAGLATLISRIMMLLLLFAYIQRHKHEKFFNYESSKTEIYTKSVLLKLTKLGFPIGIQYVVETACFTLGTIFVGWFGAVALAAHQIVMNLAALTYLMASGLSSSATIRISNLIGKKSFGNFSIVNNSLLFMTVAMMLCFALIFIAFPRYIAWLFVSENNVIILACQIFTIAAFFQVFDGLQVVSMGILRGMQDVKIPTVITLIAYWLIAVPLGYYLGVVLELKTSGIWLGYLIGLGTSAGLLLWRIRTQNKLYKKMITV